jgi:competence protein ComEC
MGKETTVSGLLWPSEKRVLVRIAFLYVGQGSCLVAIVRDGGVHRALVIDSNLDRSNGGIDVPRFLKDLLPNGELYAFVNTHPHDDHLAGVKEIGETLTVQNVWHSGHLPTKKYGTYHPDLKKLMETVERENGKNAVLEISGSDSPRALFDAEVYFLAPADHVKDDVNEEDADARYQRIHENCAVLRIGKGDSWVLVTGDADLVAFREHITEHHKDRLPAFVLDASHHGSRSFFVASEGDEPYLDALKTIAPEYVVMSAPTAEESRHDHPHDDAVKLYAAQVGAEKVLHTGKERETFFFDIYDDGTHSGPQTDEGKLAQEYGLDKEDDGGDGGGSGGKSAKATAPFVRPSQPGEHRPRKYA